MQSDTLPVLFLGHGSPMNILAANKFTETFAQIGLKYPRPATIVCVSAHWLTNGSWIQSSANQKQIFDFAGFPDELYRVIYSPDGSPQVAKKIVESNSAIQPTLDWGLDHGAWAVLYHVYPKCEIPCLQLSINKKITDVLAHFRIAQSLRHLRNKGVLFLSSGNIVHNLRQISWDENAPSLTWAEEFETFVLDQLMDSKIPNEQKIVNIFTSQNLRMAHPTPEHLLPLVYTLGFLDDDETLHEICRGIQNAAISMACVGSSKI